MTTLRFLLFATIAIATAACATSPAQPTASLGTPPAFTPAPTAGPDKALPSPRVSEQSLLIVFDRTGGFAGFQDHLAINSSGHATLTRRSGTYEFDLSASELNALSAALRSASFGDLPEDSMPKAIPSDAFTYVVTFEGHTVRTADSAVPDSMETAVLALGKIASAQGE